MDCRATDILLSEALRSAETPPFIGLVSIHENQRQSAFENLRVYLRGDPNRISNSFRDYPYVSTWCVTQALSEEYGDQDQAIYRHIERVFGVSLENQFHRCILYKSFCRVCEQLGLPTRGFNRMVDVYLLHAGVPMPLLPQLIRSFLRQEAAFGPPPTEATVMLNRWEDDSLEFLPDTVVTPRRAILWDETAWHAALYARIRENPNAFVPKLPVEERFHEILSKPEQQNGRSISLGVRDAAAVVPPRLRLIWRADGLAARIPRVEGRVQLWQDDDISPFRLRGGEDWMLPQPWPVRLRWRVGEYDGALSFLSATGELAIFDCTTGFLIKQVGVLPPEVEVDTTDAVILSRSSFSIDGEPALATGEFSFIAFTRLGTASILLSGGEKTRLRARLSRRLTIRDGQVARGPQGTLFGPSATVEVKTGLERDEVRRLRVTVGQQSADVEIEVINGLSEIGIGTLFSSVGENIRPDPLLMRIDLLAPADGAAFVRKSGISIKLWVWPAFSGSDGFVFESDLELNNLVLEQSQNVILNSRGRLTLNVSGGYITARAVFEIEGGLIAFEIPWPDVVVIRRRPDGSVLGLPVGTRLTVDEENRFDTVTIRCPDPLAKLSIRGQSEDHPFARGLSRNLAIRDLSKGASDNRVILRRGNGTELMLFEIVLSIEPVSVRFLPARDGLRLRLNLMTPVDALALEIESEHGKTEFAEASFGRRPVSSRRPSWLSAELPGGNPTEIELFVSALEFEDRFALARIFLRPEAAFETQSTWRPLRNSRGDTYAIILDNPGLNVAETNVRWRFETLSRWLADCYADECWSVINKPLISRWDKMGRALAEQPGGIGALMMAGAVPPPDHTVRSWIPLMHPIHILPGLYEASTTAFVGLSGSPDLGLAELSKLFSLGRTPLRDQSQLHPTVYLAFRNCREAENEDVSLSGFEPRKFFANLPLVDGNPSAGWFWRGTPLLGPDHWRAAHLRFVERLEVAGMFMNEEAEAGANSRRQEAVLRLSRSVWEMIPEFYRPHVPLRSTDREEPHSIDLWVAACLSAFAHESRMGNVDGFVVLLGKRLEWPSAKVLGTLALMLRLAPELFAFFLLAWQIAKERP